MLIDTDQSTDRDEFFLIAGYSSVLHTPLDKTLLFNAIHAAQTEHTSPENVVSLAEHYRQRASDRRLKILVAEDNETNQKVIKGILERANHITHIVNDGEQALDMLEKNKVMFDLIILDMNMPGMSGLDVVKTYRFMDTSAKVPVVMLTANATLAAREACRAAGANSYLTKPVDARRLLETVAELTHKGSLPKFADKAAVQSLSHEVPALKHTTKLDETKLESLVQLGSGPEFVKELVDGFRRDGERLLEHLQHAVETQDYPELRDAAHALKGTAGELGGIFLVNLCKEAETLKPYDMASEKALKLVEKINNTFMSTCQILAEYIQRRSNIVR